MTTPVHHPTTHLKFEFDDEGRVVYVVPYEDSSLGETQYRLFIPQVFPGTRGAIVPRAPGPVRAENYARLLIEENGGYRP